MLIVGEYDIIQKAYSQLSLKSNVYIVNLSSANIRIEKSNLYYIPNSNTESSEYDLEYANFIFNNTKQRTEFLYMVNELMMNNHVLILIGTYRGYYEMAESLLKLVQTRYGYNGYILTSIYDLENMEEYESDFSIAGMNLFDIEKQEIAELYLKENGGEVQ